MEITIILIGIANLVTTVWLGSKILRRELEPIQVVFMPVPNDVEEQEPLTAEEEPVNSVVENTAPVHPSSNTNNTGPWVNRKGIPLNEAYKPKEPPAPRPETYGWVR